MDARGQHGRRHQVVHDELRAQEGRVLLQNMVLRQEDLQVNKEVDDDDIIEKSHSFCDDEFRNFERVSESE